MRFVPVGLFLEMNARRTSSGFGPNPITYTEITAWSGLRGITLSEYELDVLNRLEHAYLDSIPKPKTAK